MLIAFIYVLLNLIADLLVMLLVPKLREPRVTSGRLRFLRSFSGALGAGVVVGVLAIALLGPVHRAARSVGADRRAAQRRLQQRLARHRLPRPRRLSRLLYGGRSVILVAFAATCWRT